MSKSPLSGNLTEEATSTAIPVVVGRPRPHRADVARTRIIEWAIDADCPHCGGEHAFFAGEGKVSELTGVRRAHCTPPTAPRYIDVRPPQAQGTDDPSGGQGA